MYVEYVFIFEVIQAFLLAKHVLLPGPLLLPLVLTSVGGVALQDALVGRPTSILTRLVTKPNVGETHDKSCGIVQKSHVGLSKYQLGVVFLIGLR